MDANNSNAKRKYESAMPVTDEGWWESVLAEERQYAPPRPPQGGNEAKTCYCPRSKTNLCPQFQPQILTGRRSRNCIPMIASLN